MVREMQFLKKKSEQQISLVGTRKFFKKNKFFDYIKFYIIRLTLSPGKTPHLRSLQFAKNLDVEIL